MKDLQKCAIQLAWEVKLRGKHLILDWDGRIRPYQAGFKGITLRTTDTPQTILSKLEALIGRKDDGVRIKTSLENYIK